MNALRKTLVPLVVAVMAIACGGGDGDDSGSTKLGGGKQGAAKALHQANRPVRGDNSGFGLRPVTQAQTNVTSEREEPGTAGGKAIVKETVSIDASGGVRVESNIQYVDFSEDGKNRFNGSLSDVVVVGGAGAAGDVSLLSKGHLEITGEVTDTLDADVTVKVSPSEISATTGSVSVNMSGTITTSTETYTYANEAISIDVGGTLPGEDTGG